MRIILSGQSGLPTTSSELLQVCLVAVLVGSLGPPVQVDLVGNGGESPREPSNFGLLGLSKEAPLALQWDDSVHVVDIHIVAISMNSVPP